MDVGTCRNHAGQCGQHLTKVSLFRVLLPLPLSRVLVLLNHVRPKHSRMQSSAQENKPKLLSQMKCLCFFYCSSFFFLFFSLPGAPERHGRGEEDGQVRQETLVAADAGPKAEPLEKSADGKTESPRLFKVDEGAEGEVHPRDEAHAVDIGGAGELVVVEEGEDGALCEEAEGVEEVEADDGVGGVDGDVGMHFGGVCCVVLLVCWL